MRKQQMKYTLLGLAVKYQVFLGKNGFLVENQLFPRKR